MIHDTKHSLIMMLLCAVPLLLLAILPLFGIATNNSTWVILIIILALHVVMMGVMNHKEKTHGEKHQ